MSISFSLCTATIAKAPTTSSAAASHGVFAEKADRILVTPALDRIAIADTIPPFRLTSQQVLSKLDIVEIAPLVAEAIRRLIDFFPSLITAN
ncbi:hypothetical protein [Synechococcus sp. PCC 7336]|uniref:hypothetical protein n=1 Tax=Synechococcus sp. PCC 7336 TaxID=195250 RepID=UPI000361BDA3|nr:hypothetical protein [Synechococcus sp. PCC 7336]